MICPHCGHDNLPGSEECSHCLMDLTQFVFNERFPRREPQVRARMMDSAREVLGTWLTTRASGRMPALDRVKVALIERGRAVKDGKSRRLQSGVGPRWRSEDRSEIGGG